MEPVCRNRIFLNKETGERRRVLWISPDAGWIYWIGMDIGASMPESEETSAILEMLARGVLEESAETEELRFVLTPADEERRDRLWNLLKDALLDEPRIYEQRARVEHLKRIAEKSGKKVTNLYRYLLEYWKGGQTPDAFVTHYRKSGAKGKSRTASVKKLGRPPHGDGNFGKKLGERDFQYFEKAIQKYYLTRNAPTFQTTYEKLLSDFYSVTETDADGKERLRLLPPEEIPSISQFRYWYGKRRNLKEEIQKRKGAAKYELTSRSVLGKSDFGLMGPGAEYQIDATVGDIYLISQFDRSNIIGRPVMYFVMDSFSRMVTGMYVGLEGPSWTGAMMALYNAAGDKVSYCREFGIPITEEEWPCRHIPAAILADRGEMESRKADNLTAMLGIRVENAPPYRADLKGIIEQHFRTINANSTVFLPGKVKPDMLERGGKDYRLDAKLDIRQFTSVVIKCVLYYNNSHYMASFEKSEQMIRAGVEAVPVKLWNWGIRFCSGSLRTVSEEKLKFALMPFDTARVTDRGIRFKGLYYGCQEAAENLWFEKARSKGSYKITVSYDPRDMGQIYAWDGDDGTYLVCDLLDWEEKFSGKQIDEVRYEQEKEKLERKRRQASETEAKINLNHEIDAIVKQAERTAPSVRGVPKSERLAGIRKNRKEERERIRREESFTGTESAETSPPAYAEEEEMSPVLRMIRRKMEESVKDESLYAEGPVSGAGHSGIPGESSD